jgi:hypothetical protein
MTKYDFLIDKKICLTIQPPGHPVLNTIEGIVTEVKEFIKWGDNIPCWSGKLLQDDGTIRNVVLEGYDTKVKIISKYMKYRKSDYFNETDTYLFKDSTGMTFESKVEHTRGSWFTVESLEYKAVTLPCKKL